MGHRILVVDDNTPLRENVAEILAEEGHEVSAAGDGAAALARLGREPVPEIVILDLLLPGAMDGREVAAAIRADPRLAGVRLLVISGLPPGPQTRKTIPADGFLAKPFGIAQLLDAIRAVSGAA